MFNKGIIVMSKYVESKENRVKYNEDSVEEIENKLSQMYHIYNGRYIGNPYLVYLLLPKNIKIVGEYAFQRCPNLWRVQMEAVETVGKDAFKNCENLKLLSLNHDLTKICEHAFFNTGLINVNIPKYTKVEEYAFAKSKLVDAYIPNLSNLKAGVFCDCESLSRVIIDGGEVVPQWCFHGCKSLTDIVLPAGVVEIKNEAFTKTGLKKIRIPTSTKVEEFAFDEGVEIIRYDRTEEHLLQIMCQNFLNSTKYPKEDKVRAEGLIARLLNGYSNNNDKCDDFLDPFEDDMK